MNIKWNIDTSYVTRIPDWEVELDDCDLEDWAFELTNGATEEDILADIEAYASEDFAQRVTQHITNEEEILAEIRKRAEKIRQEEEVE